MIFLDTNVVSEPLRKHPERRVMEWLVEHDAELALSTVVVGEIAYGIEKIRPDERADRLAEGLAAWRSRFSGRIHGFCEDAAMLYGELMGRAGRSGRTMTAPDGVIAAIAMLHEGALATRNAGDFEDLSLRIIDPWE